MYENKFDPNPANTDWFCFELKSDFPDFNFDVCIVHCTVQLVCSSWRTLLFARIESFEKLCKQKRWYPWSMTYNTNISKCDKFDFNWLKQYVAGMKYEVWVNGIITNFELLNSNGWRRLSGMKYWRSARIIKSDKKETSETFVSLAQRQKKCLMFDDLNLDSGNEEIWKYNSNNWLSELTIVSNTL